LFVHNDGKWFRIAGERVEIQNGAFRENFFRQIFGTMVLEGRAVATKAAIKVLLYEAPSLEQSLRMMRDSVLGDKTETAFRI
jgi:hypothetical protein